MLKSYIVRHCNETQISYGRLVTYYAYQITERRKWQYRGLQQMTGVKQDAPRRRGAELFPHDLQMIDFKWEEVEYCRRD